MIQDTYPILKLILKELVEMKGLLREIKKNEK